MIQPILSRTDALIDRSIDHINPIAMSAPPSKPRPTKPPSARPLTLLDCVATASSGGGGGGGGGDSNSGATSRARILEQQREVMLRRRQEALRADVVRSVEELGAPQPSHYSTPAIPQFSSPRPEEADPTSAFSSTGGNAGSSTTTTLSSTLSSTASSTAPLNPTQVTEAKRAPSSSSSSALSIQPPSRGAGGAGAGGGSRGKPRSSAVAAFRAKAYRRVSRSSGEEGGASGGGRQLSLSGDEEQAWDGAFLADGSSGGGGPSPRPPAKPDRRRKEEEEGKRGSKTEVAVALAMAAAADETRPGFDLEGLLSRSSGVARFVTASCPPEAGVVQCYIKRMKKGADDSM